MTSGTSPWTFNRLTPFVGQARSFEVYVHLPSAPGSNWQSAYSVSDGGGTPTLAPTTGTAAFSGAWYDLGSVTLAAGDNSTTVTLSQSGGASPVPDQLCLGYPGASSSYDAAGEITQNLDRNGRAVTYSYDSIGRETGENWYPSSNLQNPTETISYAFDPASRLQSATDQVTGSNPATDSYTYDNAGEVVTDTQAIPGLTPSVVLTETYTAGNRTQLATAIGGTNDFVNNYLYQGPAGQMSQVTQSGVNGGNAVAPKLVGFTYDNLGEFATISRYANLAGTQLVATGTYGYDNDGNMTSLAYTKSGSTLPSYTWAYNALGDMASETNNTDGTVNYTNDSTGQLTGANGGQAPNESYSYDANGNRTSNGYTTGANNEVLFDGTYNYQYDAEGNRIARWQQSSANKAAGLTAPASGDTNITLYGWDNRDRLTSVTQYGAYGGSASQTATHIYDVFNRWIAETITAGGTTTQTRYVYDGNQIVMQFDGTGNLTATNLSHRYLWGPGVDQLLADEQLQGSAQVVWTLGDSRNTVRDLATYNSGTNTTTVANHRVFSAYGQLLSPTNPSVDCLFAYTGRPLDRATGLQNNFSRWYDSITGRWLSEDPIGFAGGDANLYRYCGNGPVSLIDPFGMQAPSGGYGYEPPPAPNPNGNASSKSNCTYIFPYLFPSWATPKNDRLCPIPGIGTPKPPIPQGPSGGDYRIYPFPGTPPGLIGGGGSETCIVLVVKGKGYVAVFHFTVGDNPGSTLAGFSWPQNPKADAIVCGGNGTDPNSNCLADDVIRVAKGRFNLIGVSAMSCCGVDQSGKWYEWGPYPPIKP